MAYHDLKALEYLMLAIALLDERRRLEIACHVQMAIDLLLIQQSTTADTCQ